MPIRGPHAPVSLAVGPLNVAGQGYQWAEAASSHLTAEAFSFANSRPAVRRVDGPSHKRSLHHRLRPSFVKRVQVKWLLRGVTHLLDESFATITGDHRFNDLNEDLGWLRSAGMSVAVVFHGSDVRSPQDHLDREPFSFFRLMGADEVADWEATTATRRRLARSSGLPLFVSTPDLLLDLPEASWLPLVIDPAAWHSPRPALGGSRVRVLHVPSRRTPPIKGTSFIDPVLTQLAREGVVEYVSPESVPHEEMPRLVASVDVVIDQILTGSYGVAAVEAMAAGRLVLGNVGAGVREKVGSPVPILDCSPDDLAETIRTIAASPERYQELAASGPAFVARYHSGAESARVLDQWLCAHPAAEPKPATRSPRER